MTITAAPASEITTVTAPELETVTELTIGHASGLASEASLVHGSHSLPVARESQPVELAKHNMSRIASSIVVGSKRLMKSRQFEDSVFYVSMFDLLDYSDAMIGLCIKAYDPQASEELRFHLLLSELSDRVLGVHDIAKMMELLEDSSGCRLLHYILGALCITASTPGKRTLAMVPQHFPAFAGDCIFCLEHIFTVECLPYESLLHPECFSEAETAASVVLGGIIEAAELEVKIRIKDCEDVTEEVVQQAKKKADAEIGSHPLPVARESQTAELAKHNMSRIASSIVVGSKRLMKSRQFEDSVFYVSMFDLLDYSDAMIGLCIKAYDPQASEELRFHLLLSELSDRVLGVHDIAKMMELLEDSSGYRLLHYILGALCITASTPGKRTLAMVPQHFPAFAGDCIFCLEHIFIVECLPYESLLHPECFSEAETAASVVLGGISEAGEESEGKILIIECEDVTEEVVQQRETVADVEAVKEQQDTVADVEVDIEQQDTVAGVEAVKEQQDTVADVEAVKEQQDTVADVEAVIEQQDTVAGVEAVIEQQDTVADVEAVIEQQDTVADVEAVIEQQDTVADVEAVVEQQAEDKAKAEAEAEAGAAAEAAKGVAKARGKEEVDTEEYFEESKGFQTGYTPDASTIPPESERLEVEDSDEGFEADEMSEPEEAPSVVARVAAETSDGFEAEDSMKVSKPMRRLSPKKLLLLLPCCC